MDGPGSCGASLVHWWKLESLRNIDGQSSSYGGSSTFIFFGWKRVISFINSSLHCSMDQWIRDPVQARGPFGVGLSKHVYGLAVPKSQLLLTGGVRSYIDLHRNPLAPHVSLATLYIQSNKTPQRSNIQTAFLVHSEAGRWDRISPM